MKMTATSTRCLIESDVLIRVCGITWDSEEACAAPPRIDGDAMDPPPSDAIAGGTAQMADGGASNGDKEAQR